MSFSIDAPQPEKQSSGDLPPWSWVWLLLYFFSLPVVFGQDYTNLLILVTGRDGSSSLVYTILERVMGTAELLLSLTVLLGVVIVFLPHIRKFLVERKCSIIDSSSPELIPEDRQTLDEIRAFLRRNNPAIVLKYGYKLRDRAAVYPLGYGKVALAVSYWFLSLWRKQNRRSQAEATLLHEIAHSRHGDAFIVGAGSFLVKLVNNWLSIVVAFVLAPFIIGLLLSTIANAVDLAKLGASSQEITQHIIQQMISIDVPGLGLLFLSFLFWTAFTLTMLVASIWCTEFNADRFVLNIAGSDNALVHTLEVHSTPRTWMSQLLFSLSHPPRRMRTWMASYSGQTRGVLALLLFFPLAYFVKFLFQLAWIAAYNDTLYFGQASGSIASQFLEYVKLFFEQVTPIWIGMALLLLCWPLLTRYWEWLFVRTPMRVSSTPYRYYILSASLLLILCLLGTVYQVAI
jgi:Zn-dependent protease with chaperone function